LSKPISDNNRKKQEVEKCLIEKKNIIADLLEFKNIF